jgi:hypothetical protein
MARILELRSEYYFLGFLICIRCGGLLLNFCLLFDSYLAIIHRREKNGACQTVKAWDELHWVLLVVFERDQSLSIDRILHLEAIESSRI